MDPHHDRTSGPLAPESVFLEAKGADALSEVLRAVRLSGALFFVVDATSPWLVEIPSSSAISRLILPGTGHLVSYHVVAAGSCWARVSGEPPMLVKAGDVLIVPHGDPYVLSTDADGEPRLSLEENLAFFRSLVAGELPFVLEDGGGGPERLRLVCGFLGCEALPFNPVLASLPRLVHVRRPATSIGDRLNRLVEFALDESRENRAGSGCVLLRISELLFIEVVRRHLESLPAGQTGWLAGLRDPAVGRALALLHRKPAHPWTLEKLAKEAGLSRSSLAERFSSFVGQPPIAYLMRWRMQLAAKLLSEDAPKVSAVAMEVGYESEAAFSRAFKKSMGVSPAAWRDRRDRD